MAIKNKKIYVVTDGQYSNYRIIAIFDDMEKAEACAKNSLVSNYLEIFDLNPILIKNNIETEVAIKENGIIVWVEHVINNDISHPDHKEDCFCGMDPFIDLILYIPTEDKERAIKVAAERLAFVLANNIPWGDNEALKKLLLVPSDLKIVSGRDFGAC